MSNQRLAKNTWTNLEELLEYISEYFLRCGYMGTPAHASTTVWKATVYKKLFHNLTDIDTARPNYI